MSKLFQKIIEQTLVSANIREKNIEAFKKELESNFLDQKDYLVSQGLEPNTAEEEIIKKFGNPEVIGKMYRKYSLTQRNIKHSKIFALILGVISILAGLYYAFAIRVHDNVRSWMILAIIAVIAIIITSKINHQKFSRYIASAKQIVRFCS